MRALFPTLTRLDRFDAAVIGVSAALLLALALVIARGDRVGVTVAEGAFGPTGTASSADRITVRFGEAMDRESVEARLRLDPPIDAATTWRTTGSGDTLIVTPRDPLRAGATYRVTIEAGAAAARHGRTLTRPLAWSFTVRLPRVVYLAPADGFVRNLWITDLATGATRQLTESATGIEDYAVSPDGSAIAYTRREDDGTADIWRLDLASGAVQPLTNCVAAICSRPAWQPDGAALAYQREDFNTGRGSGVGQPRLWLVDALTLETDLLFRDSQMLGSAPVFAPDGDRLAFYDPARQQIRVLDLRDNSDTVIESIAGVVGAFSPDGDRLVYPVLVRGLLGQQFYAHLEVADFERVSRTDISGGDEMPVEDGEAAWAPDGRTLAIARRYLDDRFTAGRQIYRLDVASGEAVPLVVDGAYNHAALSWDAAGERLLFQRFPLADTDAAPEIWLLEMASGELTPVARNAFLPAWVP